MFSDSGSIYRGVYKGASWYFAYQCTMVWKSTHSGKKKSWMNQENAYSKGCEVNYLFKSKTSGCAKC